jgi:hypothetical protein
MGVPYLKRLDAGFPPRQPGFASGQHVGFMVDAAALGQVFSSTSVSPASHSTNFSIIIITRGWHNRPLVAAVPSGHNWTPPSTILIKKKRNQHEKAGSKERLVYTSTLKVTCSSETSVNFQRSTRRYISENETLLNSSVPISLLLLCVDNTTKF